jgi:FAD:protein FMN transferase
LSIFFLIARGIVIARFIFLFFSARMFLMKKLNKKSFDFKFSVMGCPCQIQLYCEDKKHFKRVKVAVLEELNRLDRYYTNYSDTSFTAEMNRTAVSHKPINVDEETAALLDYSHQCYIHSDGLFDITAGTLRKVWDYHAPQPCLPSQEQIEALLPAVGWDKVQWNRPELTLPVPGMVLDFGGVVKEYAADAAAGVCYKHDVRHGLINLGGDMRVLGPHADGRPWCIGVVNPQDRRKDIAYVYLHAGAIVTSGNYERCIEVDGKRYSHILNPKTGWPVEGFSSVTILGDYCLVAGSAATIASLKSESEALAWLNELGLPYVCIANDGTMHRNC